MTTKPEGVRLQKYLASAGVASRRASEELIREGRVTVNGNIATLGQSVTDTDVVCVDSGRVNIDETRVYWLLNKPRGYLTTTSDPQNRRTIFDLLPPEPASHPVGRLDMNTRGLLIVTNDGDLTVKLTHPRYGVTKKYVAVVKPTASNKTIAALRRGVELTDGTVKTESVKLLDSFSAKSTIEIVVSEGRNRLVRRMLEAVDLEVVDLVRVAIGPLEMGRLREGAFRNLSPAEIRALRSSANVD